MGGTVHETPVEETVSIKSEIENKVYSAIVGKLEQLESDGIYKGNGHHLAQALTTLVVNALK